MSLAEELLADLENFDEEDDIPEDVDALSCTNGNQTCMIEKEERKSVRDITALSSSTRFKEVMKSIDEIEMRPACVNNHFVGPVEADPEYNLIVDANNFAVEIDNEIMSIHKFVRDIYSKRFPELESLVVNALEYVKTVKELGNKLDQSKNNETLQQFLTQATIMVVSVTASTTQGKELTKEELTEVIEACDMIIQLNNYKMKIYGFVESRMTYIAPNLSVIVGASTAAKLIGVAGGLNNVAKMAACNLLILGSQKKTLAGFSQSSLLPHTGFIYYSPIVQKMPPDLKRKAARTVAAKSTLAARVDSTNENSNSSYGRKLLDEILKKFDKWMEPPPVKFAKPLPKPVDPPRKRRGGKKVRKTKERYAMTELRKQQNRIDFMGVAEEQDAYQEDLGYSRGTIGKSGTGRIRTAQVDEKTKVRISKTLQKNLQKQQVYGGTTSIKKQVSGTASSVAFTPSQGLEIINPQAAERSSSDRTAKYFSNTSGFHWVKK